MEQNGLMLCTVCGIGDALNTEALTKLSGEVGAKTTLTHEALCSPEGQAAIRGAIENEGLDGLLIAACSHRVKTEELRFDGDGCVVERVSLREQVVWSHPKGEEDTQMLAEDLVRMGGAKLQKIKLPERVEEEVATTVLITGGGLTGLEAARAVASCGYDALLVESDDKLGGYLAGFAKIPPQSPPYDRPHENPLPGLIAEVENNPKVRIFKSTKIKSLKGQPGQFDLELETPSGSESIRIGAVVQATGATPYPTDKLGALGHGEHADVITSHELEKMIAAGSLKRPSNGATPRRVLFVQCAGSRDPEHLPYCSSECCLTSLKQVSDIHEMAPETEAIVVYRDMRTPGQSERFYEAVQQQPQTFLARGDVAKVSGDGNGALAVHVKDSLLGDDVVMPADLVVLALGMVPKAADGESIRIFRDATRRIETGETDKQKEDARKQAEEYSGHKDTEILNLEYRQGPDLPVMDKYFPDSHYICFPYETRRTGIYTAGALRAPMGPGRAAEDGWGAAMKAMQCISAAKRGEAVHPRAGDTAVPEFFLQRCTQCKRCTEECPFGTLNEDEKGTPELNALRCRRCGICMGACPERIISFAEYSVDAVSSMVKAMEVPEDDEEKPRILALLCENDALPALDAAAGKRLQWNPWVRIVPVRCLGSVNIVWIADSLSRGIDGVILIGCVSGDDYQCHYIQGSELASKRLENVQETLQRLALEPERIQVVELSHDEFERIPKILDEFAETLEEMGPNPMKGF